MKKAFLSAAAVVAALALPGSPALAQTNEITIGITVVTTGPAAALGIPERNALEFVPKEIGGVPIKVISDLTGTSIKTIERHYLGATDLVTVSNWLTKNESVKTKPVMKIAN